ncbi:MAG: gamma-glutamylcyclotransferase [Proteobacteria bacterium]|nr:gamma-glutamylcyclotransferase [Pseudomonadota bacterium]
MNHVIWQLCRSWVKFRRGRIPPRKVSDPVWYFAFGSNMNERLFKERRHMTPIETRIARLEGYRLCFTVVGGRRPGISAPANIVEAPGDIVYGVLYLLPLRKFARLDASEGRQYAYLWINVADLVGSVISAVTYKVAYPAPEGRPSLPYLNLIREAARQRDLPADYMAFLDRVEPAG